MVQALGCVKDEPSSLCICEHDVQRVESFIIIIIKGIYIAQGPQMRYVGRDGSMVT